MGRADSLEKTLVLGKIEGRRRRGQQRKQFMMGTLGHAVSDPNSRGRQRLQICFLNFWEGLETKEQPHGWYVFEYR